MTATRKMIALCFGAVALLAPLTTTTAAVQDECAREELMSYFPARFVTQTLDNYKVPQGQRTAILRELADKDKQVIPTVEERAAKMNPNPLRDPKQRQEAVKIFRDVLSELFTGTMEAHGINDKKQIQEMLDDIQQQKAKQFAFCMDKMKPADLEIKTAPKRPTESSEYDQDTEYDEHLDNLGEY